MIDQDTIHHSAILKQPNKHIHIFEIVNGCKKCVKCGKIIGKG